MRSQQLNPIRIGSHQIVIREVRGLTHENGLTFIIIRKTRKKNKSQKKKRKYGFSRMIFADFKYYEMRGQNLIALVWPRRGHHLVTEKIL